MITIDLYQPKAVNLTIPFPSTWNDFTLPELELVAKTILSDFKTPMEAQAALFMSLLQMRTGNKIKHLQKRLDAEDAVINGLPAIEFIYKNNDLTRQPYPALKVPQRSLLTFNFQLLTFYGRADDFNDLTCGEFEDAEFYYNKFVIDRTPGHLANLSAILYRPKGAKYLAYKKEEDAYVPYDAAKLAPRFKKLKPWVLYCIFLWYAGCRDQLPKIFPNCFGPAKQASEETREPDFLIFTKCIHAGAGPKNGTRNQIRCTLLKEFFLEVELQNIENQKLQEAYDNAK